MYFIWIELVAKISCFFICGFLMTIFSYHSTEKNDNWTVNNMELIQAKATDFERITGFYRNVIDNTENMDIYGRWIYGLHPTDEMKRAIIS